MGGPRRLRSDDPQVAFRQAGNCRRQAAQTIASNASSNLRTSGLLTRSPAAAPACLAGSAMPTALGGRCYIPFGSKSPPRRQ